MKMNNVSLARFLAEQKRQRSRSSVVFGCEKPNEKQQFATKAVTGVQTLSS